MENIELLPKNDENYKGDPGKPPVCGEEKGINNKEKGRIDMFLQQNHGAVERKAHHQLLQDGGSRDQRPTNIVVNILLNNIIVQRGFVTHEQKWEDRTMVRAKTDEITIGTEHWVSKEWKEKGRVAGAKLKPDLVWLRCDSGNEWQKVVVDVKITSTEDMNKAFNNKNDKYLKWTTRETKEKKVVKAVMVPLIVSHDGAIHRDSVNRWNHFAKDIKIDWVRIAQNVVRYNVVIVGKFFNKGSWVSEAWRRDHPEEFDGEAD